MVNALPEALSDPGTDLIRPAAECEKDRRDLGDTVSLGEVD
jgi:hypothetical protein